MQAVIVQSICNEPHREKTCLCVPTRSIQTGLSTATIDGKRLEILDLGSKGILSMY